METKTPHVVTDVECPTLKARRQVELAVNVFREADHKGLEVQACSEFLGEHGAVTCGKACIHTAEAKKIHKEEAKKHREDLEQIGPNVIG